MANGRGITSEGLRAAGWIEINGAWRKPMESDGTGRACELLAQRSSGPKPKCHKAPALVKRRDTQASCAVCVSFIHFRAKLIDLDNLDCKDLMDAIRDTGLVPDDGPQFVREIRQHQIKVGKGEEGVIIHVEYLSAG